MMPFLPLQKVCSCNLFQENLKVELFVWTGT